MLYIDIALEYHLFSNHYPPLPGYAVDIAKQVISDPDGEDIKMPNGYQASRAELIDAMHLNLFLEEYYEIR